MKYAKYIKQVELLLEIKHRLIQKNPSPEFNKETCDLIRSLEEEMK